MPVQIACPKCSKRYSLPDSALGKSVQCKACGTSFRTKKPGTTPTTAARTAPTQGSPGDDLSQFGIEGGFQKEADLFNSPPPPAQAMAGFGNFAEEDPGFDDDTIVAQGKVEKRDAADKNPYQSIMNNPALRQVKKSDKKSVSNFVKVRKEHIAQETEIKEWGTVMIVLGVLSILYVIGWAIYGIVFASAVVPKEAAGLTAGLMIIVAGIVSFINLIQIWIGWAMRRLNGFGRIGGTIIWAINLIVIPVGTVAAIIVLRMLWNEKATIIFSPEYQAVRDATTEIKHKSSTAVLVIGILITLCLISFAVTYFFDLTFGG